MAGVRTLRYGKSASQVGDLHLPGGPRPPVVCLLHGGFWRVPAGREQFDAVVHALVSLDFAVWNLAYRRLGETGGGWPGTFHDVATGLDHLAGLAEAGIELDLERVIVAGHSAGGHLALWSAARTHPGTTLRAPIRVRPIAAAALAPAADLARIHALGCGGHAVEALLGGAPRQRPARYEAASPVALLPLGVQQLVVHGRMDQALPVELSRQYVQAARLAGDAVEYHELPEAGHMDFLDPASSALAPLLAWLEQFRNG